MNNLDPKRYEVAIKQLQKALNATMANTDTQQQTITVIQKEFGEYKSVIADDISAIVGEFEIVRSDISDTNVLLANAITAIEGEFDTLSVKYANIDLTNIANGTIKQAMIADGQIVNAHILDETIGSSKIHDLTASKLSAGIVDMSQVTIRGSDGRMEIADNTIQINDTNRTRVQLGKDASDDYTLAVWDKEGKLIWDALGATENTIQRKIIRDGIVADDANIQGYKLDIDSVVTEINEGTTKISETVVKVGDKSLDVVLSETTNTIEQIEEQKMYRVIINSSNGNIFKNGAIDTVLSVEIYSWDNNITDTIDDNELLWTRVSDDAEADKKWNDTHFGGTKQVQITPQDVYGRATFLCALIDTTTRETLAKGVYNG